MIEKHQSLQNVENLKSASAEKENQLKTVEENFVDYVKKRDKDELILKNKLETSEKMLNVENLKSASAEKENQLKTVEENFVDYVKKRDKDELILKNKLETSEKKLEHCQSVIAKYHSPKKRKALKDCSNSYNRKKRKCDEDVIKSGISDLKVQGGRIVTVAVERNGKKKVIHTLEQDETGDTSGITESEIDVLKTLTYILDSFKISQRAYHELHRSYTVTM
ncbi:CAP-Gly domain-containing linker protein 1-like [Haliotis asinina]|uniref:CAP-Gly domain-containing linker protein 1-like n=1 Tax=Haliotis asinina TaxID=109174 RepID=UPI003531C4FC